MDEVNELRRNYNVAFRTGFNDFIEAVKYVKNDMGLDEDEIIKLKQYSKQLNNLIYGRGKRR